MTVVRGRGTDRPGGEGPVWGAGVRRMDAGCWGWGTEQAASPATWLAILYSHGMTASSFSPHPGHTVRVRLLGQLLARAAPHAAARALRAPRLTPCRRRGESALAATAQKKQEVRHGAAWLLRRVPVYALRGARRPPVGRARSRLGGGAVASPLQARGQPPNRASSMEHQPSSSSW